MERMQERMYFDIPWSSMLAGIENVIQRDLGETPSYFLLEDARRLIRAGERVQGILEARGVVDNGD